MNERPDNVAADGRSAAPQGRSLPEVKPWSSDIDTAVTALRHISYSKHVTDDVKHVATFSATLIERLNQALAAKQAEIDRLMIEHCPEEMTQAQVDEWAAHQAPAPLEDQYDGDSAYG